jgi:hypothetical protein
MQKTFSNTVGYANNIFLKKRLDRSSYLIRRGVPLLPPQRNYNKKQTTHFDAVRCTSKLLESVQECKRHQQHGWIRKQHILEEEIR